MSIMEVKTMRISIPKLELAMARNGQPREALRPALPSGTLARIRHGCEVRPYTVGRIAQALGVDPADILED